MCGFVGNYNFKNDNTSSKLVKSILKKIYHRGPDQSKIININKFCLGFNRLSIVGTKSKHSIQPLRIDNQILLFNGEIYNYSELYSLVANLINNKNNFGDTEVLFNLIKKYGIKKTLNKVKGMYAFAWIDLDDNTLHLARDRIGEKPLYYFNNNNEFWFGSEIKCITLSGQSQKTGPAFFLFCNSLSNKCCWTIFLITIFTPKNRINIIHIFPF